MLFRSLFLLLIFPAFLFGKYDLSICAIFKNEAPYLKEWIEFHKIQGVKHFYLYNNNSADYFQRVLAPYIEKKEVTLTDWKYEYSRGGYRDWLAIQRKAYNDCLQKYGKDNDWIAFIDLDEFLFCLDGTKLSVFLKNYDQFGGLLVNWLLFGTSGVNTIPTNKLMIEMLNRCSQKMIPRNSWAKSIVQPKHTREVCNAHMFYYKEGFHAVNEDGKRVDGRGKTVIANDKIRINHYWTRTKKHFREHKMPSRNRRRDCENAMVLQNMAAEYNLKSDKAIHQFVPALRKKMGLDP